MILVLLIALVLVGTAAALLLRAAAMPRVRAAERLGEIAAYGFDATLGPLAPSARVARRPLEGLAKRLGDIAGGRLRASQEKSLRRELVAAGLYGVSPRTLLGYRVLSTILVPLMVVWLAAGSISAPLLVLLGALSLAGGWLLPVTLVRRRARFRLQQIDRELPEFVDLLVVTVEAGLGLSGALSLSAERLGGPLGEEVRLAIQEQSMGLSSNEALLNMLQRSDSERLRSFVRSLVQGEALGVSIGDILRAIALEMRKRRRQAAEEQAQKAPIKMLFPLVFLMFPSMFIVILAPAVMKWAEAF